MSWTDEQNEWMNDVHTFKLLTSWAWSIENCSTFVNSLWPHVSVFTSNRKPRAAQDGRETARKAANKYARDELKICIRDWGDKERKGWMKRRKVHQHHYGHEPNELTDPDTHTNTHAHKHTCTHMPLCFFFYFWGPSLTQCISHPLTLTLIITTKCLTLILTILQA